MKPLEGVKVLDFSRYIAGPLSTMYLANFGAEVVKVENPKNGDDSRLWEPIKSDFSGYFTSFNRNKKSITLDLKKDNHRNVIYNLIDDFDIVVGNFSPGVSERLGIDYETLRKYNSSVIYCDISGFGQEGPYKNRKGFDTIFQAMGGLMSLTGTGDGEPVKAGVPIGDYSGALFATISILVSLLKREKNGEGEYIDLSLYESVINLLPLALAFYDFKDEIIKPKGTEHPGRVPSSAFKTNDEKYVQISVTNKQWYKFCETIGISEEISSNDKFNSNSNRVKNRTETIDLIQSYISKFTQEDITKRCELAGIPCGPVYNIYNILEDKQVQYRNTIGLYHESEKNYKLRYINFPGKFKNSEMVSFSPPPILGENNNEIL